MLFNDQPRHTTAINQRYLTDLITPTTCLHLGAPSSDPCPNAAAAVLHEYFGFGPIIGIVKT